MAGKLVVIWILGGAFVALLILNVMFAGGSSAADSRNDRLPHPGPRLT